MKLKLIFFISLFVAVCAENSHARNIIVPVGIAGNFREKIRWRLNTKNYYIHFENGVKLAIDDYCSRLNQRGIKIKLEKFNFGGDKLHVPSSAYNAVRSDVIAVVGYGYSSEALLAAPVFCKNRTLLITPSATADRLDEYAPYIKRTCFNNHEMVKTIVGLSAKKKIKTVAIISNPDCAYSQDVRNQFKKLFSLANGKIVSDQVILSSGTDCQRLIKRLTKYKYDALLIPNYEENASFLIRTLYDAGIRPTYWLGGDSWGNASSLLKEVLKNRRIKACTISHWNKSSKDKKIAFFIKKYKDKFKLQPIDASVLAYDAFSYLILGILKAENLDRKGILQALNGISSYDGIAGRIQFGPNRVSPLYKAIYVKEITSNIYESKFYDQIYEFSEIF